MQLTRPGEVAASQLIPSIRLTVRDERRRGTGTAHPAIEEGAAWLDSPPRLPPCTGLAERRQS
jgi:hypothetical protein